MAHALREFIRAQMIKRRVDQSTVVQRSGLSRSHVSKLLSDEREVLPQLPRRRTIEGLAKAFGVSQEVVLGKAIEALGIGYTAADFVYGVANATDRELLDELAQRLSEREARGEVLHQGDLIGVPPVTPAGSFANRVLLMPLDTHTRQAVELEVRDHVRTYNETHTQVEAAAKRGKSSGRTASQQQDEDAEEPQFVPHDEDQ